MSNMDDFDRYAVFIFDDLLTAFPQDSVLGVQDFEPERNFEGVSSFVGTAQFLRREGFIHFEGISETGGIIYGATLTMKGLTLLRRVPGTVSNAASVGDKIAQAAKSLSKEAIKAAMGELFNSVSFDMLKGASDVAM